MQTFNDVFSRIYRSHNYAPIIMQRQCRVYMILKKQGRWGFGRTSKIKADF